MHKSSMAPTSLIDPNDGMLLLTTGLVRYELHSEKSEIGTRPPLSMPCKRLIPPSIRDFYNLELKTNSGGYTQSAVAGLLETVTPSSKTCAL
jgi:hypothetical protein